MKKMAFLLTLIASPASAGICDNSCRAYIHGIVSTAFVYGSNTGNLPLHSKELWPVKVCGIEADDVGPITDEIADLPLDFSVVKPNPEFVINYLKGAYPCR